MTTGSDTRVGGDEVDKPQGRYLRIARIAEMIAEERFILEALTEAYQIGELDYAHYSPAYDVTACRIAALTASNSTTEGDR